MLSNNPGLWSKFHAPWKILKKREVTVLSHETGGEERCGCTMSDEHYHHIIIINNKKAGPDAHTLRTGKGPFAEMDISYD